MWYYTFLNKISTASESVVASSFEVCSWIDATSEILTAGRIAIVDGKDIEKRFRVEACEVNTNLFHSEENHFSNMIFQRSHSFQHALYKAICKPKFMGNANMSTTGLQSRSVDGFVYPQ